MTSTPAELQRGCTNLSLHAEVYVDAKGCVKCAFAFVASEGTIIKRIDLHTVDGVPTGAAFMQLVALALPTLASIETGNNS